MSHRNSNRQIVLRRRPVGLPVPDDFEQIERPIPEPGDGELLVRNLYVSLSPAARIRMDDRPSYAPPLPLGGVVYGPTVGEVVASRHAGTPVGTIVVSAGGWQDFSILPGAGAVRFDPALGPLPSAMGVFGISGMTAYVGVVDVLAPKPGQTLVVSAASGAVGSLAGQIGRIKGCRVVGIAGGPRKCAHVVETLGFDACVDYKQPDFADRLADACPDGIDLDFENVGGAVRDAVFARMNDFGRIAVCGLISQYNDLDTGHGPDWFAVLHKRLSVQGFMLRDHDQRRDSFLADMAGWVKEGRLRYVENIVEGLPNAPGAFIDVLQGRNLGKAMVHIADPRAD